MNKSFKIIPVLDLKEGIVVLGMKGERDKYKPLESILTSSVQVMEVIKAFYQKVYLTEYYLADLDAIGSSGERNQLSLIAEREKNGLEHISFMVDAGIKDKNDATIIFKTGVDRVVIGTETLSSLATLGEIIQAHGSQKLVVSIDIKHKQVLSPSPDIASLTPPEAIKKLSSTGIRNFIIIELDRVGTGLGLNKELIRDCVAACEENFVDTLIIGGGISGFTDLKWLKDHGVTGALVASALHKGSLDLEMIRSLSK